MKRREFIVLLGGAAGGWPLTARAQQGERMRRIAVLVNTSAQDPQGQAQLAAFHQALQQLGWSDGGNVHIDTRWGANDLDRDQRYAKELVALAPDVILASSSPTVAALQRVTNTVPIVFVRVADPLGAGFVDTLARPGANITGFMLFEYSLSGKWLELLKQIAPGVTHAAVLRDPANPAGIGEFAAIQSAASSLGIDLRPVNSRDVGEIERSIESVSRSPGGGLIVTPSASISYGPDRIDEFRRAATYVDRILKGEKPAELPVQAPTRYELVINLKTAKAIGLSVPSVVVTRADKVIE